MWGDRRFCALSHPPPNAQFLWVYLLTGPHNTNIPGLFVLGVATLAERLQWPAEATARCCGEIVSQGMAEFDRASGLVWLPKAMRHNQPANPNVVIGWRSTWSELPECDLRDMAQASMAKELGSLSEAFRRAFEICLGMRKPNASPNPTGRPRANRFHDQRSNPLVNGKPDGVADGLKEASAIQEQEQEQPPLPPPPAGGGVGGASGGALRLPTEDPPRRLSVTDAQQAILDGLAGRKNFRVVLSGTTELAFARELVTWARNGVTAEDFVWFGRWVVEGGPQGEGGLAWATKVRVSLQWLLQRDKFVTCMVEAWDWRDEVLRKRAEDKAPSAVVRPTALGIRDNRASAEEMRSMDKGWFEQLRQQARLHPINPAGEAR